MAGPFGVLALQGGFAAHAAALRDVGVEALEVRRTGQLAGLSGLVIPGGESTTLLNLMRDEPWFESLKRFHAEGGVVAGTCAGAILLARDVRPAQPSLGLLDAVVERNAFGRQVDSFEAPVRISGVDGDPFHAVFIRAPWVERVGEGVEVLGRVNTGRIVAVRQRNVLATAFHPELTGDLRVHRLFVDMARRAKSTEG
jgi:5'-phosphate synthase pdxT subunit